MSARPWSGRLALGGGRLEESPLAVVAGQEPALVADGQGIVRKLVDEDRTADVVGAVASGWQLKHEPLEAHSAVVTHGALMLTREHEAQIHGDEADERALGLRGLHREAAVEVGGERRGEIRVGRRGVRDPGGAELLGGPALERAGGPLTAAVGVIERHDEVMLREGGKPAVGRPVEVDEHADQRPALALAAVPAAPRGLRGQAGRLQDQAGPRVGELAAMLLRGLLPEVLDGEVGVAVAAQPTQPLDDLHGDAPATRRAAPLVVEAVVAAPLPGAFEPPQVSWRDVENV